MRKRYIKFLSILFIVLPMSIIMALVGVFRIYGFTATWYLQFIKSWSIMFPVAYCSAFIFAPVAQILTKVCESKNHK